MQDLINAILHHMHQTPKCSFLHNEVSHKVELKGLLFIMIYCCLVNIFLHDKSSCLFVYFSVFTSGDKFVKAFDAKSGTCKRIFSGHTASVGCLMVSQMP